MTQPTRSDVKGRSRRVTETLGGRAGPGGIFYIDTGPSESRQAPYLLVHGLGASLSYWAAIIPELSAAHRVIAVDVPGFGDSPANPRPVTLDSLASAIAGLAASLNISRPILVGHSLGATLVLLAAEKLEAQHLILLDGHLISTYGLLKTPIAALHHPSLAIGMILFSTGLLIPGRGSIARALARYRIARILLFSYLVAEPAELDPQLLRTAFSKTHNRGVWSVLRAIRHVDLAAIMKASHARTTVAWGAQDPLILESDTLTTRRLLGPDFMHRIPNCGHWPMLERPAEVLRILKAAANDRADHGPG